MGGVWEAWLPKSILALRGYDRATFRHDLIAGDHRRAGRAAAGDGVCDRLRPHAPGRHLLRDRHRLHHLGARRLARPDRRSDRRLRRRRLRHRRRARRRGPVHVHDDGRRHARHPGRDGDGHGGSLHPAPGRRRVHQRHRGPHREHADSRFSRAPDDREPRRVPRPPRGHWPPPGHDHSGRPWSRRHDAAARARHEPLREG